MWKKKEKELKRKPKYGMFSCVAYMYKLLWESERHLVFVGILYVPMQLAAAALALYTPSVILSCLESEDYFSTIALVVLGLLLADTILSLADMVLQMNVETSENYVLYQMEYLWMRRRLDRDFFLQYDPKVRELDNRANNSISSNHTESVHFPMDFASVAAMILKFFLFGTVISMLNPWIILLLAAGSALNIPIAAWERKRNYNTQDDRNILSKKIDYLSFKTGRNFKYGKDIRLYNLQDYLVALVNKLLGAYRKEKEKVDRRNFITALAGFLVVLARDGAVYAYLISRAVAGEVDAAQFVLYFTAVTEMAGFMSGITWWWSRICEGAMQISDFREAMEVSDRLNRESGIPIPRKAFSIEFKDVSFRYEGGEKNILEHVSFKIAAGEKLALVGVNGAGKTTLTRLMCGLLLPTEGEILLDGHSLQEYNRDEMYALFGVVPQNYNLLPFSIARNIACREGEAGIDRGKIAECLRLSGLEEKIDTLALGADTPLNRQVNPEGIDLSGGEIQKLLLARLLYRSPQCIILDEPTAALDPIAEDRMYRKYNEITNHATSVFISHRLASTRFCDRILFLEDACIAECGTHEELMAAGGRYRELFEVQSKYYKNNSEEAPAAGEALG